MTVVGAVMLRKYRQYCAPRLGPGAHVDRSAVEISRRARPLGSAHVEPEREHQREPAVVIPMDPNLMFVLSTRAKGRHLDPGDLAPSLRE